MASWHDRAWRVRRWLADRLIGDHAYSKNLAPLRDVTNDYETFWHATYATSNSAHDAGLRIIPRNPGETS